jgi:cellulose synthase/poly-beta-1,6-N-acetylglucosamine synthase-like glycosyltransferase
VKKLDYPNKEVIVVNDYPDKTPEITKRFGFRLINNKERQGKAKSLNQAVEKSTGEILFFLDSDTTLKKDTMKKIIPWFSRKGIAVVAPKYVAKNQKGLIPRMVSLENSYNSTMFKMHMFFGSMISFRGCGIAIKRSVFKKMNGWSETLIEDSDFAAKITHAGYKIQYEPSAVVETYEPTKFSELKKQKLRWGRGSGFVILNNKRSYANNFQAILHFLPYTILSIMILVSLLMDFVLLFPLIQEFFLALLSTIFVLFVSLTLHNYIIMLPERIQRSDFLYIPVYTVLYLPVVLFCYVGGIAIGITDRIRHKPELDFRHW